MTGCKHPDGMNSLRQILTPESIVNNNNNNDTVRKLVALGWLLAVKYVKTAECLSISHFMNNEYRQTVRLFQYCLRWTRHPNMLSDALVENERCLHLSEQNRPENDSNTLLDVVIHLDDGSSLKLHSLVLAASSILFQAIGQVRIIMQSNESLSFQDHSEYLLYIIVRHTTHTKHKKHKHGWRWTESR